MENTQLSSSDPLMADLSAWKRQEQFIVEFGSSKDLQTKRFKTMKLKAFDRLWFKYRGSSDHPDRVALLKAVQFHRKELEGFLFKGLFGWIALQIRHAVLETRNKMLGLFGWAVSQIRRTALEAWNKRFGSMDPPAHTLFEGSPDTLQPDQVKDQEPEQTQASSEQQGQKRSTDINKFRGWDYGPKKKRNQSNGLGL